MRLDVRTILLLRHPDRRRWLLLRRSKNKKLFPGLITGLGGRVELESGEAADLPAAALRELREESGIGEGDVTPPRLRVSTIQSRGDEQVVLLWFSADLLAVPAGLSCPEGELTFFERAALPLDEMIPTARSVIPFVISLEENDKSVYNGVFEGDRLNLLTARGKD